MHWQTPICFYFKTTDSGTSTGTAVPPSTTATPGWYRPFAASLMRWTSRLASQIMGTRATASPALHHRRRLSSSLRFVRSEIIDMLNFISFFWGLTESGYFFMFFVSSLILRSWRGYSSYGRRWVAPLLTAVHVFLGQLTAVVESSNWWPYVPRPVDGLHCIICFALSQRADGRPWYSETTARVFQVQRRRFRVLWTC